MEDNDLEMDPPVAAPRHGGTWWRVLLIGLLFYGLGIILLVLTGNTNLFPTVGLLGSFMVPAAYVTFFYERRHLSRLKMPTTAQAFLYGGVLGVFAASILEPLLIQRFDFLTAFQIGFIEESAKILGILLIARRFRHDSEVDGVILGAAAGMGFAALESMGYAFSAFLGSGGSLSTTVVVTLLRGLLSPLGHGTWTAILAAVMFRESRANHFRFNLKVLGAFLGVVALHGLWDGLPTLITYYVGSGLDVFIAQAVVGVAGLLVLWLLWRQGLQREPARELPGQDDTPGAGTKDSMEQSTVGAQ